MVVVSGEAESAGEVDFELVEGLVPAGGSGAEVAAAARRNSLSAEVSVGKWPRVLVTLRSWKLMLSTMFVV